MCKAEVEQAEWGGEEESEAQPGTLPHLATALTERGATEPLDKIIDLIKNASATSIHPLKNGSCVAAVST